MEVLGEGRRTQSSVLLKAKPFPELIIFFLDSSLDWNEYLPAIISKQEHIFIANITNVGGNTVTLMLNKQLLHSKSELNRGHQVRGG